MSVSANINFTQAAAEKVKTLIDEEQNSKLKLRVYISGGGCSGFQYGFGFEEATQEADMEVTRTVADGSAVTLLVDPVSYQYLKSAEIDYREDINGAQFVIRNPNAKTTCGCGSSFSAFDQEDD